MSETSQEELNQMFSSRNHTFTSVERTEISTTRGGGTRREVQVKERSEMGRRSSHLSDVLEDFLSRDELGSFASLPTQTGVRILQEMML